MDKHFTIAGAALTHAAKEISYITHIEDVSTDGDNKSAEIIFSVNFEGVKKSYVLKLEELSEDDCKCEKCGSWLNNMGYCKNKDCDFADHLQTEDITGDGH